MKVLHVGEYVQGGVATYISMLLNHPRHTEIKDYIICSDKNSEHNGPYQKDRCIIILITGVSLRFCRQ